jgi:hypothetical protein
MTKPRHDVYLDDELSRRLNEMAAKPGSSKSAILSAALKAYLDGQGANQVDQLLQMRLNRFGGRLERIERDQRVVVQTLAEFVRHHFLISAPLPEHEMAARRAQAETRYQAFIDTVGRQLAASRPRNTDAMEAAE